MEERICFLVYKDWEDAFSELDDKTFRELMTSIFRYGFRREESVLSPMARLAMRLVKPVMERDWQKFDSIKERNKKNSVNAGRKKKSEEESENPKNPVDKLDFQKNPMDKLDSIYNNKQEYNKQEEIIEEKNINTKKESRFIPPTIEEVAEYAAEKGYIYVDAEKFCNFYDSKGWFVGKNKMKKWRSAVSNWNKTEKERIQRYGTTNNGIANAGSRPTHAELFNEAAERLLREMPLENDGRDEKRSGAVQESLPFD